MKYRTGSPPVSDETTRSFLLGAGASLTGSGWYGIARHDRAFDDDGDESRDRSRDNLSSYVSLVRCFASPVVDLPQPRCSSCVFRPTADWSACELRSLQVSFLATCFKLRSQQLTSESGRTWGVGIYDCPLGVRKIGIFITDSGNIKSTGNIGLLSSVWIDCLEKTRLEHDLLRVQWNVNLNFSCSLTHATSRCVADPVIGFL